MYCLVNIQGIFVIKATIVICVIRSVSVENILCYGQVAKAKYKTEGEAL